MSTYRRLQAMMECFSDYRSLALTPIIMKCLKKLFLKHIKVDLLPHNNSYRVNRSTDDAIATAHLEQLHIDLQAIWTWPQIQHLLLDKGNRTVPVINTPLPQKTSCMLKDSSHPVHYLFVLLHSGCQYKTIKVCNKRLKESFYPKTIIMLGSVLNK